MKKTYISTTGDKITFPVEVAGKVRFISFNGTKGDLTTEDVKLQNAIETSRKFKSGAVALLNGKPNTPVKETPKEVVVQQEEPVNTPIVTIESQEENHVPVEETQTGIATGDETIAEEVVEQEVETKTDVIVDPVKEDVTDTDKQQEDTKSYPDVTDYQTAASILRKLGAAHQSVRTPGNISKKALEMGIEFPNLK